MKYVYCLDCCQSYANVRRADLITDRNQIFLCSYIAILITLWLNQKTHFLKLLNRTTYENDNMTLFPESQANISDKQDAVTYNCRTMAGRNVTGRHCIGLVDTATRNFACVDGQTWYSKKTLFLRNQMNML